MKTIFDHGEYWVNVDNREWANLCFCVKQYEKGFDRGLYWVNGDNRVRLKLGCYVKWKENGF